MGRPPYEPSDRERETVRRLAGYGMPIEDIAAMLPKVGPNGDHMNERTLRKHFAAELAEGRVETNQAVVQSLFNMATGRGLDAPVPSAAIFWTKARMGWTDRPQETTSAEEIAQRVAAAIGETRTSEPAGDGEYE
jgi:hypothetical protein